MFSTTSRHRSSKQSLESEEMNQHLSWKQLSTKDKGSSKSVFRFFNLFLDLHDCVREQNTSSFPPVIPERMGFHLKEGQALTLPGQMRRVSSPSLTPAADNTLARLPLFWWHHFKWKEGEDADRRPEQSWSSSDLPETPLGWGWTGWWSREQSEILTTVQTPSSKPGWSHYKVFVRQCV